MTDLADRYGSPLESPREPSVAAEVVSKATQHNLYLHYLRGVAALFVVLYHCSEYLRAYRNDDRFLSYFGGFFGAYGVAVFFAISGYLIAEVLRRDDPARFVMSRVARIYPLMLLMVGLFALTLLLIGTPRAINPLSLSLVPSGPRGYFLGVEWTLLYEMSYYVGLGLIGFLGLATFRTRIVVAWFGLFCVAYSLGGRDIVQGTPILSQIPLSVVTLPFLLGYIASEAYRRGWLHPLLACLAIPFGAAALLWPDAHFRLTIGLSASFLAAGLIAMPAVGRTGRLGRAGVRLGDASYALYLCHVPVITILGKLLGGSVPTPLVWGSWLIGSVGIALLLAPLDVAIYRRLKRAIDAARPARLRRVALSFVAVFLAIAMISEQETREAAAELEAARQTVLTAALSEGEAVQADVDQIERLASGTWIIRGYAVDLASPDLVAHFAIRQSGKILGIVGTRRMRVDIANALERPDLKGKRFGFMLLLDGVDCAKGPLEALIAFEGGRAVKLPAARLAPLCLR